jgi:dihydrodipicolinate synthase/N-acetylneuraminate lyase
MKEGMAMRGLFRSALVRPPVLKPSAEEVAQMRAALAASGVSAVVL